MTTGTVYNDDYLKPEVLHEMLGQNIRRLRRQKGMTQEQLAEKADVGQKQISKIESGRVHAKLSTYLRIANAFGVSIDHFLADALLVDPQQRIGDVLRGESEQRLIHDMIQAMVQYLEEKKT